MAVSTYALISLVDAKAYMRVTGSDDDTLITRLIDAASARIEKFTDRDYVTRGTLREWHSGARDGVLVLRNWPVIGVTRVAYGSQVALEVTGNTSSDIRATVEVQDDKLVLTRYDSSGDATATSLAFSSYKTTATLATQVTATSGWSGSAPVTVPTLDLHRTGGKDALSKTAQLTWPEISDAEYRVDDNSGLVHLVRIDSFEVGTDLDGQLPRGRENILVEYSAGYADTDNVPEDLAQIAVEFVHSFYLAGKQNPNLQSESLGDYSYSTGGKFGNLVGAVLTDDMQARLENWRSRRS